MIVATLPMRLPLLVLIPSVAVLAFAGGYLVGDADSAWETEKRAPVSHQIVDRTGPAEQIPKGHATDALTSESIQVSLFGVLSHSDEIARMREFCALLPQVTVENWRGAVTAFRIQREKLGRSYDREMRYFLQHLGRVAGKAPLEEALDGSSRDLPKSSVYDILEGWASVAPDATLEWFRSRSPLQQNQLRVGVAVGMAQVDPKRALAFLSSEPDVNWDLIGTMLLERAVNHGGFRSGEEVFVALQSNPKVPSEELHGAFDALTHKRVFMGVSQSDAGGMLEWLSPYFASGMKRGSTELLTAAARIDPTLTISWMDARAGDGGISELQYNTVAEVWYRKAPAEFAAWLKENLNHPQHDNMAHSIAGMLINDSKTDDAAPLVELLRDPALRTKAQEWLEKARRKRAER